MAFKRSRVRFPPAPPGLPLPVLVSLRSLRPRVQRVAARRPDIDHGMAWVYLGVLNSLRPAAVGGEPEKGRAAFERAVDLSDGRNLMAKTLFAEFYARLVFDQELHDQLLNEVISADPDSPGLTLSNVLAQDRAKELLAGSADYF